MSPSKISAARQHPEAGHNTVYLATTAKHSSKVLYDDMQRDHRQTDWISTCKTNQSWLHIEIYKQKQLSTKIYSKQKMIHGNWIS